MSIGLTLILSLVAFGFAAWQYFKPREVYFYPVGYRSKASDLPSEFERAWAYVQDNLSSKYGQTKQKKCSVCGRSDAPSDYSQCYKYKGFVWSSWEREHMMYAHVKNAEDGVYLPDWRFVHAIMTAWRAHETQSAA